jgi:signal transduction histidine kinase
MGGVPKLLVIVALMIVATVVAVGAHGGAPAVHTPSDPVVLSTGWQYRWEDSPVDSNGTRLWLLESAGTDWEELPSLGRPPDRRGNEFLWYRTRLPDVSWTHPTLFLPNVLLAFEAYLDTTLLYQYGEFYFSDRNKYSGVTNHLIQLPDDCSGRVLAIRVYSHADNIGIEGRGDAVRVGSERDVIRAVVGSGTESTLLGLLFIFIGLFSVLAFASRSRERVSITFSFGAFSFLLGVFYVMGDSLAQLLIKIPAVKLYSMQVSYFTFPVAMFIFIQYAVGARRVMRIIWVLHLIAAVALIAADLLHISALPNGMRTYSLLFVVTIPVTIVATLRSAIRGSREARILVCGFAVFGLTGFIDILTGLGYLPYWHWVSQWGGLGFILCLAYILERRFTESHRRLQIYSEELEDKSQQLREYSRTLEQKVLERTQDLDDKNRQLESTLTELRETQQQLIMKEKMASLGNLVAGVAHEVNNPIGAVKSAADVSARCIGMIQELAKEKRDEPAQAAERSKFQTAVSSLLENNRIITTAVARVSKIVKSLKNFSRLDEAEFQAANIHDGIDSTLTLVQHKFAGRIEVIKDYGDIPEINVYPNQLNQVFMNLLVNAAEAIEDKGTVTVKTFWDEGNLFIVVSDTGRGIPPDQIDRIFDPGFTTKGVGVGTGLGLSISYGIIQKHGGTLTARSEVGRGTDFVVSLPL